jgi:hypothetical protein
MAMPHKPEPSIRDTPIGQLALYERLQLRVPLPAVRSFAGPGGRRTVRDGAQVIAHYPSAYLTDASDLGHLRFMLKHEPFDLGVLAAAFEQLGPDPITAWAQNEPTGALGRRAWFLYERLTGEWLDLPAVRAGSYVDALDPDKHLVIPGVNSPRHRVRDNLLGVPGMWPFVRRTERLAAFAREGIDAEARRLTAEYPPELLARAVNHLYGKETRSSFGIEGELPSSERAARFIRALRAAPGFDANHKQELLDLQKAIVDPRYALDDWRGFQNFIGQDSEPYFETRVDFIFPRPEDVAELMGAWMAMTQRLLAAPVDAVSSAAVIAFAFVFIHPFWDGNGRLHRFMIHHVLAKRGFSPPGMIFPVSAAIARDQHLYNTVLDSFSQSRLPWIDWRFEHRGELNEVVVNNDTRRLYSFFDATAFAEYLYERVAETVRTDLCEELGFLRDFDRAARALQDVVDLPKERVSLFIRLCFQNDGRLSQNKRALFKELQDDEIVAMEAAIATVRGKLES